MKKCILIILFISILISMLSAIDIPFFKKKLLTDEECVKQDLLKCKDVKFVEMIPYHDFDDTFYTIHIYLNNHRYLCFGDVTLSFYKATKSNQGVCIKLIQINDLVFEEEVFEPSRLGRNLLVYARWRKFGEIRFLEHFVPALKICNMLEIIENIDDVYNSIYHLPEKVENDSQKNLEFERLYGQSLEIPEEFDNGITVSVIEKKTGYDNEKWYEIGYKFYKIPVERAIKEATYKYAYKGYRTDY